MSGVTAARGAAPAVGFPAGIDVLTVGASPFCSSPAWFRGTADAVARRAPDLVVAESTAAGHVASTVPTVTRPHGIHWNELASAWATWRHRRTLRALTRTTELAIHHAHWSPRRTGGGRVVALTRREARRARSPFGVRSERISVSGAPVQGRSFAVVGATSKGPRIVFDARLDGSRGGDLALHAVAVRRARVWSTLELAGDGRSHGVSAPVALDTLVGEPHTSQRLVEGAASVAQAFSARRVAAMYAAAAAGN